MGLALVCAISVTRILLNTSRDCEAGRQAGWQQQRGGTSSSSLSVRERNSRIVCSNLLNHPSSVVQI